VPSSVVAVSVGVRSNGSAEPGALGARSMAIVWNRLMYDAVSLTAVLYEIAFGPRSGESGGERQCQQLLLMGHDVMLLGVVGIEAPASSRNFIAA